MPASSSSASSGSGSESSESSDDQPLNPLEAKRQAEARRVAPPGTGGAQEGRKGSRGGNPKAPRHYNRHK
jgi:hypothetical protein